MDEKSLCKVVNKMLRCLFFAVNLGAVASTMP